MPEPIGPSTYIRLSFNNRRKWVPASSGAVVAAAATLLAFVDPAHALVWALAGLVFQVVCLTVAQYVTWREEREARNRENRESTDRLVKEVEAASKRRDELDARLVHSIAERKSERDEHSENLEDLKQAHAEKLAALRGQMSKLEGQISKMSDELTADATLSGGFHFEARAEPLGRLIKRWVNCLEY